MQDWIHFRVLLFCTKISHNFGSGDVLVVIESNYEVVPSAFRYQASRLGCEHVTSLGKVAVSPEAVMVIENDSCL